MREPRFCKQFYCDMRGDRYCCRDCWYRANCRNPCQNDPSRCRLEDTGGRVEARTVSTVKG